MLERKTGISPVPSSVEVQKVTDDIYTVQCNLFQEAHYAYTNWVVTDDGVVIIDAGTVPVATLVKKEIEKTGKPVKYIIYSHGHFDHTFGAAVYLDQQPEIIAQENILPRFERYARTGEYFGRIMQIQICRDHPVSKTPTLNYPTITYSNEYSFQLGGKTFELFHGMGETDDCTLVWVPECKAVFLGDLLEASFPNLGNPYKVMRYAKEWAEALERALALKPDFAIGGDVVLTSNREIEEHFKENIELLMFLEDSVVTAANQGKSLEQMTEEIQLPPHLENSPRLRPLYSRREFAIYNIWKRYCGYFDFSAAGVLPGPKHAIAAVSRELIGNDERILEKAGQLLEENKLQLALETLDLILRGDYEHVAARRLRMAVLKKLADSDICVMSHNAWVYYMNDDEKFLASK
jgi:glyoxylase-like metal-dependent hydrolase (beta-lactamase superfamily II)